MKPIPRSPITFSSPQALPWSLQSGRLYPRSWVKSSSLQHKLPIPPTRYLQLCVKHPQDSPAFISQRRPLGRAPVLTSAPWTVPARTSIHAPSCWGGTDMQSRPPASCGSLASPPSPPHGSLVQEPEPLQQGPPQSHQPGPESGLTDGSRHKCNSAPSAPSCPFLSRLRWLPALYITSFLCARHNSAIPQN